MLLALARDPAALEQLRAEQEKVVATHGTEITLAALQDMSFADAVVKEVLRNASPEPSDRMRSVTVIGVKKALKDFELGGFHISEGTTIITNSAYMSHNDPRWQGAPLDSPMAKTKFCPARWLTEAGKAPGGDFMPFAAGPRGR